MTSYDRMDRWEAVGIETLPMLLPGARGSKTRTMRVVVDENDEVARGICERACFAHDSMQPGSGSSGDRWGFQELGERLANWRRHKAITCVDAIRPPDCELHVLDINPRFGAGTSLCEKPARGRVGCLTEG